MKKNVIIAGGLGNQMFQYALLLSLRHKGVNVCADASFYKYVKMHNGYELKRVFGVEEPLKCKGGFHLWWLRFLDKYSPSILCTKDSLTFDNNVLSCPKQYIRGYWQSELYFKDIRDDVRGVYQFKGIDEQNIALADNINEKNSVSIHIRRGDYASFGMTIIGADYYKKAISIIKEKINDPFFYVFSDDEKEAKEIMDESNANYQLITHNRGDDSYKDMYLMSQCKHNIIANSSFSWWGAWLNNNRNKIVIAPKWLKSFNLESWIEL